MAVSRKAHHPTLIAASRHCPDIFQSLHVDLEPGIIDDRKTQHFPPRKEDAANNPKSTYLHLLLNPLLKLTPSHVIDTCGHYTVGKELIDPMTDKLHHLHGSAGLLRVPLLGG
jgi:hypothetical protein